MFNSKKNCLLLCVFSRKKSKAVCVDHEEETSGNLSIEEFKKAVIESLKEQYGLSLEEEKNLMQCSEEMWEQYSKDFSPRICAQGINSGLI